MKFKTLEVSNYYRNIGIISFLYRIHREHKRYRVTILIPSTFTPAFQLIELPLELAGIISKGNHLLTTY